MNDQQGRLVVGISGASGVILGIRLLELMRQTDIETHLIVSQAARATIAEETEWKISDVLDGRHPLLDQDTLGCGQFLCR